MDINTRELKAGGSEIESEVEDQEREGRSISIYRRERRKMGDQEREREHCTMYYNLPAFYLGQCQLLTPLYQKKIGGAH